MGCKKLKPCPFCGSAVTLNYDTLIGSDSPEKYFRIICPNCEMGCPDALYEAKHREEIIKAWNTRTLEPVVREAMKSVNQAAECIKNNDEEQALYRLGLAAIKLQSALKEAGE